MVSWSLPYARHLYSMFSPHVKDIVFAKPYISDNFDMIDMFIFVPVSTSWLCRCSRPIYSAFLQSVRHIFSMSVAKNDSIDLICGQLKPLLQLIIHVGKAFISLLCSSETMHCVSVSAASSLKWWVMMCFVAAFCYTDASGIKPSGSWLRSCIS